ncbi:DUF6193 family natural product biosynthesis protein [Streptomyces sp. NBC_01142]|uniref:DUF6193 family natural product biosynthesis protein n=1 Tax=Streptomyces sp. NBC_01142 TaxID=2975865 RepID=UPI0022502CC9|nr:DUF6193 family natural product biosynthesis protein [Streptomyces sp. NBC_01142]MCX4821057.1 DUF6193 family natural product biosynthesis protein [Streptomyces sp. NBC_01142]
MNSEPPRGAAEIVAAAWQRILELGERRINPAIPPAAHAHSRLRELFPMVSHGALYFSRCTQYPWTHDVAALFPRPGGFHVFRHSDRTVLGEPDTVEEAVELIVASLPDNCGPAIEGTPDDL